VGSGKSTIAAVLSKMLGDVPVLNFDHCGQYAEWPHDFTQWVNAGADPNGIVVPKLKDDLLSLLDGKPITDPLNGNTITPAKIIFIEEPSGRERQEIRELVNLVVYIDVPQDICVIRMIERTIDMQIWHSKGTFEEEPKENLVPQLNSAALWITQYQHVRPMYIQVSQIVNENLDMITNGLKAVNEIVSDILSKIKAVDGVPGQS
jgi:uridine kinase